MLGRKLTFVFGKQNVLKLTDADNYEMNFESAYGTFLKMAFGNGILTRQSAPVQVNVLKRFFENKYLESYLAPSRKIAVETLEKRLRSPFPGRISAAVLGKRMDGAIDLQQVILETSFTIGARNFLGDEFLKALSDYDYKSIFNGFEMGLQFATEYIPGVARLKEIYDSRQPLTPFAKAVLNIANSTTHPVEDKNMFECILSSRSDPNGPSLSSDKVLVNLMKIIVFGSGFNGYNMMSYFLRANAGNRELWASLREEQRELDAKYGEEISDAKISDMQLLYRALMTEMYRNTFPFLLRYAENDYKIGDFVIPAGHNVAYSPQLEHDGTSYVDDQHFNLIFGKGTHACPARKYAKNSMMIILSELIKRFDLIVLESEPMVNTRLITFPTQPSIMVKAIHL
ncbi:hypothetical protein BNJ_00166 [Kaumoebavirus]|uniref:hypothetical protein n=1 Tax=Kaumoebavirus TaxID=1859492 RepID=UPI0009C31B4E|nr:hypothetical protein BNJ_00166 [Kaumoebavirus]ARA71998.1 hypothetical protein BNJ_00166 [Kaumoebavirus]